MKEKRLRSIVVLSLIMAVCFFTTEGSTQSKGSEKRHKKGKIEIMKDLQMATFGSGCFWCSEAVFERVNGVESVLSGYAGGESENPTYEEVCSGNSGHAEVIQLTYDPNVIKYDELLEIFWKTHDPTTLNRQGNDVGPQYRSVIFYHNGEQKQLAENYKTELEKSGAWENSIVTEIAPFKSFFKAEDYHQNYYENNPNQGYCTFVIVPKIEKFEKVFRDKLK
jgi:peptide-methionine (S)-S-oxide reductase